MSPRIRTLKRCAQLLASGALFFISQNQLHAANYTWTSTSGTYEWGDSSRWSSGVPGQTGTTNNADIVSLGPSSAGAITIDANRNIKSLNYLAASGEILLGSQGINGGEALHLSSGGELSMEFGSASTKTINAPLILEAVSPNGNGEYLFANHTLVRDSAGANTTATSAATPKLILAGNISGGSSSGKITLTLGGTVGTRNASHTNVLDQSNLISGVISDGSAQGGLHLNLNGTASGYSARFNAWNLTGLNTYSGETRVSAGALYFNSLANVGQASALGTGVNGGIYINSFLIYTGGTTSSNRSIFSNGGAFHNHGTGVVNLEGAIVTTGSLTFRGFNAFNVNGLISGNGSIANNGSNKTTLTHAANSFTGNLQISDGTITSAHIADRQVISAIGAGNTILLGQNSATIGAYEYIGMAASTNRDISLVNGEAASSGNGRILANGTGTLTLQGRVYTEHATPSYSSSIELSGSGNGIMHGVIGGTKSNHTIATSTKITKSGTGIWELKQNSLTTGTVTINAGTLLVNNPQGSATGSGSVITSGTAILGGNGIIAPQAGGSITLAANTSLMIGNTHGVDLGIDSNAYRGDHGLLKIGGDYQLNLQLKGKILFDIFSNDSGTTLEEADRLIVGTTANNIDMAGAIITVAVNGNHANWNSGTWKLIDWEGASNATKTGSVTYALSNDALQKGYEWDTSEFLTAGTISVVQYAHFWTGAGGGATSWSNLSNWDTSGAPVQNPANVAQVRDVYFGNLFTGNSAAGTWTGDVFVSNLYFTDAYTNHTQTGGTLYTLGKELVVEGGTQTLNANLRLRGRENTFTILNHGNLNITNGFMFGNGDSGSATRTLVLDGTGHTTLKNIQTRSVNERLHIQKVGSGIASISTPSTTTPGTAAGAFLGKTSLLGGTYRINSEWALGRADSSYQADHLTIDGGTLSATASFSFSNKLMGITIGSTGGAMNVESNHVLTIDTYLNGSGAITKTGSGALVLMENQSNWSSSLTVAQGKMVVSNSQGSATGSGSLSVLSGATLSGDGSISGGPASSITLQSGSFLIVGHQHGAGAVKADLLLGHASDLNGPNIHLQGKISFDLFGAGLTREIGNLLYVDLDSITNDLLVIGTNGNINLSNAQIELSASDTSDWAVGQTWKLIDWTASGDAKLSHSGLSLMHNTLNGFELKSIITSDGLYVQVVPEPSRVLLIFLALFSLLRHRRFN